MPESKDTFKNNNPGLHLSGQDTGYWKSFEQLYQDSASAEAARHEFKKGVTDDFSPSDLSTISRRRFLALAAASAALAGAGCADYRDKGEIIPYNQRPEEITFGKAVYYASVANGCSEGCGVLIKTREGRPIKVDGNPDHPVSQGKACPKCQASILNLYDPERLQFPLRKGKNGFVKSTWQHIDSEIRSRLIDNQGKETAIITNRIISPATLKVLNDFQKHFANTKIYSYELFNDEVKNSAWQKTGGGSAFPLIAWDKAKVILSLEGDFLGSEGNCLENARLYAKGKDIVNQDLEKYNRLYVVEGNMSVTGMNADYRFRLRPDAQLDFVMSLINSLQKKGLTVPADSAGYSLDAFAKKYSLSSDKLNSLIDDLLQNTGHAIIYAGNSLPEEVHMAVNILNGALGNITLYRTDQVKITLYPLASADEIKQLVQSMNSGRVAAIIHFDSNPVYHFPEDSGYKEALKKVKTVISLVVNENESSVLGNYTLPINHAFESWGDARTRTGFYSLQQPVISPIFNTRQKEAALLMWTQDEGFEYTDSIFYSYLMNYWQNEIYPSADSPLDFKQFWNAALHDGVAFINEYVPASSGLANPVFRINSKKDISGYTLVFKENPFLGDGRNANNGWLQELPHPVSKITWDNYASISYKTAEKLGVKSNEIIEIASGMKKIQIPVFLQPGSADDTITVELGFGRTKAGTVGSNTGFDAGKFLSAEDYHTKKLFSPVNVKKTGETYELVSSQEHHSFDNELLRDIEKRRGIIREGTIEEYRKNPAFLKEEKGKELPTLYPDLKYTGNKWGMAIDLNKCIGCGSCVVACTSENNIPVVGKDQVAKGREMHWIRVDRYYSGTPDEPSVSNQVMLCQHCDHAPCENVCPVVATTHSPDGLNQMVYNRCVGTRYCSNNCPYKVRRFNFFNFRNSFNDAYQEQHLLSLLYNPEVTVRSRGVMEKCTFCIQRIMEAREDAIRENRNLEGSGVTTACQDACITNAIVFGDINDKESLLNKYRNHDLGYYVLEELNVRPNVTYIGRIRNIDPEVSQ